MLTTFGSYIWQTNPYTNGNAWVQYSVLWLLTPPPPPPPIITHTIDIYCHIPSQNKTKSKLQIWRICQNLYMQHTFCGSLIRWVNMKWIWSVLLKIHSGHYSVHRQTDRWTDCWTDRGTRCNQYTPLSTLLKWGVKYYIYSEQHWKIIFFFWKKWTSCLKVKIIS